MTKHSHRHHAGKHETEHVAADEAAGDGVVNPDAVSSPEIPEGDQPTDPLPKPAVDLSAHLAEEHEKYLRLAAEYDNYRRRTGKERSELYSRAQADLTKQLIDAVDDLARFAHVDPQAVNADTVVQGAAMVEGKILKALTSAGLETINPVDQPFDPAVHEAVSTEAALSPEDDHMVARVFQPGYLFNGQLLRPARVVVKQWNG